MSSSLWDTVLSILSHPVYGRIVYTVIIILIALGITRVVTMIIFRWAKNIDARAGKTSPGTTPRYPYLKSGLSELSRKPDLFLRPA